MGEQHSTNVRHLAAVPRPPAPKAGPSRTCPGCREDVTTSVVGTNAHGWFIVRCDNCSHETAYPPPQRNSMPVHDVAKAIANGQAYTDVDAVRVAREYLALAGITP